MSDSASLTSRRGFLAMAATAGAAPAMSASMSPSPANPIPSSPGTVVPMKALPVPMTDVRLTKSPFFDAQEANRQVLHNLPADRLMYVFKVNAGLPATATPLGGWEKPDCELRGHFPGHFLSACALMYSSTGDTAVKDKADGMVAEMAKCQKSLGGSYLSAFPLTYFDRLKARQPVWAPFYTIHKIMAGLLDVNQQLGNPQALEVLKGMANWVDSWTGALSEPHMQDVLNTEFGGMNEVLYNLAGVTGDMHYAEVAHRFDHRRIIDPLAAHRDELKGLHANTNVPKIIGSARRYELLGDARSRNIADFFWYDVTTSRTYCTGGTSQDELWKVDPFKLAEELSMGLDTNECCVAYNMMKLTRHLYEWTADPRYFDYYERALYNHRLGTIEPSSGATMYFLPLNSGGWKIYNTEYDSFWCCTGTGVEEYAKLTDSIYFQDQRGIFVNLFIPSELNARSHGLKLRQLTSFPEEPRTAFVIDAAPAGELTLRVRVPSWVSSQAAATLNGKPLEASGAPGSYLAISRIWRPGDRLEVGLPMSLYSESMPDDRNLQAVFYGPVVLAAELGGDNLNRYQADQGIKQPKLGTPQFRGSVYDPATFMQPAGDKPLHFRTKSQSSDSSFIPLCSLFNQRYALYYRVG